MVGGGSRKDESLVINSTNVFAALGSLKKKKKSSQKELGSSKSKAKTAEKEKEKEKEVFWAPTPLTVKSWADVDDEDDDDYYATTAPPQSVWGTVESNPQKDTHEPPVEETESEEGLDEGDDDAEEEHENETETPVEAEPAVKKPPETPVAPKDTERQLSKKELKKKGLEELDALLAEMGLRKETSDQDGSHEKKGEDNGNIEKKEDAAAESKNAKKKKKKDKSVKEAKEPSQNQPDETDVASGADETVGTEKAEDTSLDVKGRLKKVASTKKKKSGKEMDAAARAAASEAAARNARLAAAKKKEKSHYNQQPVR